MKIYSWNMMYRNLKQDRAFAYIESLDFDVLCVQEVPDEFLERLKALPFHIASGIDIVVTRGDKKKAMHNVIVSRYPIHSTESFALPVLKLPPRSYRTLRIKEGWTGFEDKGGVYADIALPQGRVRVFSAHLTLSSPSDRAREFDVVETFFSDTHPTIVAGDFNIVGTVFRIFNWLAGAPVRESVPWFDERARVEARFAKWGLKNPLRGEVTLGVSLSQLDHILVPQGANVLQTKVIKSTYGSDHRPVFVEVSL